MGGAKYAIAFPYSINIGNPASYGFLPMPTFDVAFTSNFLSISSSDSIKKTNNTYFKNLALSFPVSKRWWATSFGIVPFSKLGYNLTSTDSVSNFGYVNTLYKGRGGINRFFVGNSFTLIKDSVQQLSAGVNVSYLFGSLVKTARIIPSASLLSYSTRINNTAVVGDFYFDAGAIYSRKINNNLNFSVGGIYEMAKKISCTNYFIAESYSGSGADESIKDTIGLDTMIGYFTLPQKIGAGLSVHLNRKWLFAADYSFRDWKSFNYFGKNPGLAKQQQYSMGLQYNFYSTERENIFKMMQYRMGFEFSKNPVLVNNSQVKEYGITFGIGIPLGEKSKGSFNLSMETGTRGENKNNEVKEQFTNVMFGFSFTPTYYDKWFVKPKIE